MKEKSFHLYKQLFYEFFKVGLFTFGGGYAMISLISQVCVEKRKWLTDEEMLNITVIAESTPGPMAINCATFTGYKQAGFLGALISTFAMIIPSFLVICLLSFLFDQFMEITWVSNAFAGIKIAATLLIIDAGLSMFHKMKKKAFPLAVMLSSFVFMMFSYIFDWHISVILVMFAAALFSISFNLIKGKISNKEVSSK